MARPTSATILAFIVVVVLGISIGGLCASDPSTPTCIVQLVPCYQFLKSTSNVPDSCCNPMRDAITNQRDCLCKLYETPGLLKTYNINITQVFGLSKACGVTATTDFCTTSIAQSPGSAPASAVPGKDQNGASIRKALLTGLPVIQLFAGLIVTMW